jgi:hypothetical protein
MKAFFSPSVRVSCLKLTFPSKHLTTFAIASQFLLKIQIAFYILKLLLLLQKKLYHFVHKYKLPMTVFPHFLQDSKIRNVSYFLDITNPLEPDLNVSANVHDHAVKRFRLKVSSLQNLQIHIIHVHYTYNTIIKLQVCCHLCRFLFTSISVFLHF